MMRFTETISHVRIAMPEDGSVNTADQITEMVIPKSVLREINWQTNTSSKVIGPDVHIFTFVPGQEWSEEGGGHRDAIYEEIPGGDRLAISMFPWELDRLRRIINGLGHEMRVNVGAVEVLDDGTKRTVIDEHCHMDESPEGGKTWFRGEFLHREDGPAIIRPDGSEDWYLDGRQHREDGPAHSEADGTERWYSHGFLHREDGPASVRPDGYQAWWITGRRHRADGPAIIYQDGKEEWYLNGLLHRDDGPAIIKPSGHQEWYHNGSLHREGGPAIIHASGLEGWYEHGYRTRRVEESDEDTEGDVPART